MLVAMPPSRRWKEAGRLICIYIKASSRSRQHLFLLCSTPFIQSPGPGIEIL